MAGLSEDKIQSECVKWARNTYSELRFFGVVAIPNGGTRHKIEAMKLTSTGVVAGFPDLIITMPNGHIFFIEIKDATGKQSKAQIECQKWMQERGIEYHLINSIDKFKQLIERKINETK